MRERAILLTAEFQSMPRRSSLSDFAQELEELAMSAGLNVIENMKARQKAPSPAYLVGEGKVEEVARQVKEDRADVVVLGNNLSPTQQRNIEEKIHAKTLDRTQLILDIFAQRARSNEGKLQVELAQLSYLLPRLGGKGIYLSRLGGGVGTRGPGEQKLEVDRRRIRERISRLSRELDKLQKRHAESIRGKKEKDLPLIALVGYTNAGKSTLFNALTQAGAVAKNQLFSTLDTTTRMLALPGNQKAFLSDTVGFVRELPHSLVESFKATLEEARQADLLLHIVDASRSDAGFLIEAVDHVLAELEIDSKKVLRVLNKADLGRATSVEGVPVSALNGIGLEELGLEIVRRLSGPRRVVELFIPPGKLGLLPMLYGEGEVLERKDSAAGISFKVRLSSKTENLLRRRLSAHPRQT